MSTIWFYIKTQTVNTLDMSVLFYIGIIMVFLSFMPWLLLSSKMMRDKKEYEQLPLKMKEIEADYKRKRFYLMLFQLAGIIIAIIGALC